jgi:hypothetical protein
VKQTAWWVRRLGAAAGVTLLALVLSGVGAREQHPAETPKSSATAGAVPSAHFGPDPDRRLSPQINRIIRLAQRSKLDEDKKGGGSQFKSAPAPKKTAPPIRKKAPVIKKKAPAPKKTAPTRKKAPVAKKKAPVTKKAPPPKKTAPPKKKAPAPKKDVPVKKDPPAQKAPPVQEKAPPAPPAPGGTPEQQQENAAYCKANPNSPKCAPAEKAPPQEKAPPTEKAPPAEKDPPAGEKEPQPGPGRPDEDAGGVGSICEQNPQLPQCQLERPDDTPPPPGPGTPPGFPPPGAPPVPPGAPPGPPPPEDGDDTPPAPSGPTIQTVTECPDGQGRLANGECGTCPEPQGILENGSCGYCPYGNAESPNVGSDGHCLGACPEGTVRDGDDCVPGCPDGQGMFAGECRNAGSCPEGQVEAEVPDGDPVMQCFASCPNGLLERLGGCIGSAVCYNQGGVPYNDEQCVEQCPEGALTYNGRCYDQCPDGLVPGDDGTCLACGDGQVAVNGACVESCPEGSVQDGTQCVPDCPEDKILFGGQCVYPGQCPEGEVEVGGDEPGVQCDDECSEGQVARLGGCIGRSFCVNQGGMIYNDQCVEQCPEGAGSIFSSECYDQCPEGQISVEQDDRTRECAPVEDCLEDERLVIYEGACIGAIACGSQGGVFAGDDDCYEQCPAGTQQTGQTCQCPAGQDWQGGECADVQCAEGEELVGSACLAPCSEGEVRQENYCVPAPCTGDEVRIDGVCTPQAEIPYDDLIDLCVGQFGNSSTPSDLGITPQESCENMAAEFCDGLQGNDETASGVQACLERPCAEGLENAGGQCVTACGEGQERDEENYCQCAEGVRQADGTCAPSCADGTYLDENGQCVAQCDYLVLNGQCYDRTRCPSGYAQAPNGECLAASCAPDEVINPDGTCTNPCPEGQQPSLQNPAVCRGVPECPEGQTVSDGFNQCRSNCGTGEYNGASSWVEYDGFCVLRSEAPYEVVLQNCLEGRGYGNDLETVSQEACEAAIVESCESNYSQASQACGDIFEPAEGEYVPPPTDGPLCPPGQAAYGDTCVDDGMITEICSGRVLSNGQCEDACPAGTVREGNRCVGSGSESPPPAEDQAPPATEDGEGPPPTDEATPPADEATPPADEATPPAEDGAPPVEEDDQAPPDEASPPEDEAPPPADDDQAPPPADEEAPPPADAAPPPAEDGNVPPPPADEAPPPSEPPSPPSSGTPPPSGATKPPSGEDAPPAPAKKPAPDAPKKTDKAASALPLAVVIAIDDYKDENVQGPPQAISNAAHIVRFLKDDLGLDGERIITGRNATASDFEDIFGTQGELRDVIEDTGAREVIVYFAGQALTVEDGKDVVLLPADAEAAKPESGVLLSSLYDALARMGVSKLRLYLDAPFAGGGDKVVSVDIAPRIGPAGLFTPPRWVALSAAGDTSKPGKSERPRSRFTESLVAGLRGIADTTGAGDGDGTVSAQELYDFTRGQAEAARKRGDEVPVPSFYGKPGEPLRAY